MYNKCAYIHSGVFSLPPTAIPFVAKHEHEVQTYPGTVQQVVSYRATSGLVHPGRLSLTSVCGFDSESHNAEGVSHHAFGVAWV